MICKSHFDVIYNMLLENGIRPRIEELNGETWLYTDYFAFCVKKEQQIFSEEKLARGELLASVLSYSTQTYSLKLSGVKESAKAGRKTITYVELKGESFDCWVNEEFYKLFPEKEYLYAAKNALSPVLCYEKNSFKLEGLMLPIRKKNKTENN